MVGSAMVGAAMVGRRWPGALLVCGLAAAGCTSEPEPDAYGNVEATEVIISAETTGQLVSFGATEGQMLAADAVVGQIDNTQIMLERDNAVAQEATNVSRIAELGEQVQVLQAQLDAANAQRESLVAQREIAQRTHERNQRLFAQQAATAQQVDQSEREIRTLTEQVNAQTAQIRAQTQQIAAARAQQQTVRQQVAAAKAQVAQMTDRLRRTEIRNPVEGTVLAAYARQGEFVQPGQPLYKIADLDPIEVRAYVAQTQLAGLQIGQEVQVSYDARPGERRMVPGTVSWIAAEAEFTPTPIQTREERADLVYAFKIRVSNPAGALKIGMPTDIQFAGERTDSP